MTMSRGRSRFTILIVDDEEQVHSSLQRFFSRYNYVILSAKNGEEALDKLDGVAVDLMLLDLLMPGIDGMTVLKKACEKVPDLKVIIQTPHDAPFCSGTKLRPAQRVHLYLYLH